MTVVGIGCMFQSLKGKVQLMFDRDMQQKLREFQSLKGKVQQAIKSSSAADKQLYCVSIPQR